MLRRRRQHAPYPRAALLQSPDEIERFIGGNAAADDEQNSPGL
jgi:hypothetical protein